MKELTSEEVINDKIRTYHTIMDNGEKRYRLISDKDNTSYIRTESMNNGGLQKSHYHKSFKEMYMLQSGKAIIYEYKDNKVNKIELLPGDNYLIMPNIIHNVYMYPNSVMHTVKYGNSDKDDWYESKELDELLFKEGDYY